jgi:hypothetical protein
MWLHVTFNGAIAAYTLFRHTELSNSKVALHCIQNSKPQRKKERKSSFAFSFLRFGGVHVSGVPGPLKPEPAPNTMLNFNFKNFFLIYLYVPINDHLFLRIVGFLKVRNLNNCAYKYLRHRSLKKIYDK